jgi:hypothetical protein
VSQIPQLPEIPKRLPHQLDGGRRVGGEDEVEVRGVGAQEGEGLAADGVDDGAREVGRGVGGVGVAVEGLEEVGCCAFWRFGEGGLWGRRVRVGGVVGDCGVGRRGKGEGKGEEGGVG